MTQAPPIARAVAVPKPTHEGAEWPRYPRSSYRGLPQLRGRNVVQLLVVGHLAEEARARPRLLWQSDGETVHFVVLGHFDKRVVGDGTVEFDVWLDPPVPSVVFECFEGVEFAVKGNRIGGLEGTWVEEATKNRG